MLDHPHIVPVYDVGEVGGRLYFAMKFYEGGNLAEYLARQKESAAGARAWRSIAIMMSTVVRGSFCPSRGCNSPRLETRQHFA